MKDYHKYGADYQGRSEVERCPTCQRNVWRILFKHLECLFTHLSMCFWEFIHEVEDNHTSNCEADEA